ncbi:28 kDa ribonucleoprotein [Thalictrum thalictroides]|uniref:28 kDa ribonucleoprotein n=1 Tax=Thalictrum thalictroides TaxID=46969 RepID=A0A7J6VEV2_THATH|nr:28 kDa ribonucleoprotein [Thalictrum thalictroides]
MKKADIVVIDLSSSSDEEDGEIGSNYDFRSNSKYKMVNTPMKNETKKIKKSFDDNDEDCIILDSDPFQSIDFSKKLSITNIDKDHDDDKEKKKDQGEGGEEEEDITVVSEKGQVACRDFPHSRDHCVKFPFNATPHGSYCQKCYCYVCDSAAPCEFWTQTSGGHCHATGNDRGWNAMRRAARPTPTAH